MAATTDPEAARIDLYCRELKLPGLRTAYPGLVREAQAAGQSHLSFLAAGLAQEFEARRRHRLAAHVQQAHFPALKTLDSFDFLALPELPKVKVLALADGSFVRKRENVLCLGQPGTGKTHLAIALGLEAIQAGLRVRFTAAVSLAQELLAAQQEYRLPRYLKSWQRIDLVILDELGYLGLGPGGPLLFQFCAERYERGSLLVTTNLDFSRWVEVFGDATLTAALLDRLTHHAQILLFHGESYRFRESRQQHQGVSSAVVPSPHGAMERPARQGGADDPVP
jgi:DNA replication protein DnaC